MSILHMPLGGHKHSFLVDIFFGVELWAYRRCLAFGILPVSQVLVKPIRNFAEMPTGSVGQDTSQEHTPSDVSGCSPRGLRLFHRSPSSTVAKPKPYSFIAVG
jgi:hypothetical protein